MSTLPDAPPLVVTKASYWMPFTAEAIEDKDLTHAMIEWAFRPDEPLTLREQITGWLTFTSSRGYSLTFRVGWRRGLYDLTHPIETWKRAHPEPECDD